MDDVQDSFFAGWDFQLIYLNETVEIMNALRGNGFNCIKAEHEETYHDLVTLTRMFADRGK